jgi:hypothetical protein
MVFYIYPYQGSCWVEISQLLETWKKCGKFIFFLNHVGHFWEIFWSFSWIWSHFVPWLIPGALITMTADCFITQKCWLIFHIFCNFGINSPIAHLPVLKNCWITMKYSGTSLSEHLSMKNSRLQSSFFIQTSLPNHIFSTDAFDRLVHPAKKKSRPV